MSIASYAAIRAVMSPLERLNLKPNKNEPPA